MNHFFFENTRHGRIRSICTNINAPVFAIVPNFAAVLNYRPKAAAIDSEFERGHWVTIKLVFHSAAIALSKLRVLLVETALLACRLALLADWVN